MAESLLLVQVVGEDDLPVQLTVDGREAGGGRQPPAGAAGGGRDPLNI